MFKFLAGLYASLIFFAHAHAYSPEGQIFVTMLNVGQGDSFLIETPTQNVLIDASDFKERNKLLAELRKTGVTRFERIVGDAVPAAQLSKSFTRTNAPIKLTISLSSANSSSESFLCSLPATWRRTPKNNLSDDTTSAPTSSKPVITAQKLPRPIFFSVMFCRILY